MRATLTTATGAVLILASAALMAQESLQERLQRATALQSQLVELHPQVVASPDDRTILRTLLETGLQYYELISTRSRFPDSVRRDLLDLKVAMQDMYAIQRAVSEIRRPGRIDGAELAVRLKSAKVPFSHRRSVPVVDPWGTPYRFFVHPESGRFKIVSAGRGKKFDPADLSISEKELLQAPVRRHSTVDEDLVFIDGRNFTRIFDYPKEAESFLYTLCEPADELKLIRCW
jgi:hypothetical protein